MNNIIFAIAGAVVGIVIGIIIGRALFLSVFKKEKQTAEKEAQTILKEAQGKAESLKKDKLLEAKEELLKLKSEHERDVNERNKKINDIENRAKQKEQAIVQKEQAIVQKDQSLNQKMENLQRKEQENDAIKATLQHQLELIEVRKSVIDKQEEENIKRLEKIAGLTAQEARNELVESLRKQAEADAMALEKQLVDDAKQRANKEARKIIIQTIQRIGAEQAIENSVNVFPLESDDVKGQIIGREGRNIRALEAACGVELIVDDTPEAIVISSFDAVRRELARLSLQRLLTDGRIHPGRIEEIVEKTRKQLEDHIIEIGERTVIELGITGLAPELVKYVGRMRFRSSYGQNLLQHSKEVAELCAVMAAELGLNVKLAKRAGLLHDIGKVLEEESELSHALAGAKIAERNKEHAAVVNAIGAHHDEMEMTFNISPIIQACDAISGARPGARREIMEQYMKRIKELETLALTYEGVEKAYAIQAGRELRVIVEAEKVTDQQADMMSFAMAKKIETEMTYPGQVKVTVIREKRSVNFAK